MDVYWLITNLYRIVILLLHGAAPIVKGGGVVFDGSMVWVGGPARIMSLSCFPLTLSPWLPWEAMLYHA